MHPGRSGFSAWVCGCVKVFRGAVRLAPGRPPDKVTSIGPGATPHTHQGKAGQSWGNSDEVEGEKVCGPKGWWLGVPQGEHSYSGTHTDTREVRPIAGERRGACPILPGLGYLG